MLAPEKKGRAPELFLVLSTPVCIYIYIYIYICKHFMRLQYICIVSVNEHAFGNRVPQVGPLVSKLSKCRNVRIMPFSCALKSDLENCFPLTE
jgi:hypothetical protein